MEAERLRQEERVLRDAVLAGDDTAWRILYDRHFEGLFAFVYVRAGRDPHRAEEIIQECWMTAVRRMRTFDPDRAPFHAWLQGIASKLMLNQRRRWARRQRLDEDNGSLAIASAESANTEASERVALVLTSLPERYQAVLRAKYLDQHPVAEIASDWGQSVKSVESLLSRARAAFREACARLDAAEKPEHE